MDAFFVKSGKTLVAVDDATQELLAQYGDGEVVRAKLFRDRNPRHHRLFFALVKMVYDNQEKYLSAEALRFAITVQAGWVDEIKLSGDKVTLRPKSLAFGKMDQAEFSTYFEAAMRAVPELLPQYDGVDLRAELYARGVM